MTERPAWLSTVNALGGLTLGLIAGGASGNPVFGGTVAALSPLLAETIEEAAGIPPPTPPSKSNPPTVYVKDSKEGVTLPFKELK